MQVTCCIMKPCCSAETWRDCYLFVYAKDVRDVPIISGNFSDAVITRGTSTFVILEVMPRKVKLLWIIRKNVKDAHITLIGIMPIATIRTCEGDSTG